MIHASFLGVDWGQFFSGLLLYFATYFGSKHGNSGSGPLGS